jgi:hypothetical protein
MHSATLGISHREPLPDMAISSHSSRGEKKNGHIKMTGHYEAAFCLITCNLLLLS